MLAACALAVCLSTQRVSNAMMLLMDRSNFIPEQSSTFFFEPYLIGDGSSNDWLYGKDLTYYYHFDRADIRTWCNVGRGAPRTSIGENH